jgi:hypothetical protein
MLGNIAITFSVADWRKLRFLLDLAVKKESMKVARVASAIYRKIARHISGKRGQVSIEFSVSELAAIQQLIDVSVQKEGMKVVDDALMINDGISRVISEVRGQTFAVNNMDRQIAALADQS